MSRSKYRSYGKFLAILCCCCSVFNNCSEEPSSSNNHFDDALSKPPTVEANEAMDTLKELLENEFSANISEDKMTNILGSLEGQEVFIKCQDISRALSAERTKRVIEELYKECMGKFKSNEELDEQVFCEEFDNKIEVVKACCSAILLYCDGKSVYADATIKNRLFDDVFIEFEQEYKKNKDIDLSATIERILFKNKLQDSDFVKGSLFEIKQSFSDVFKAVSEVNEKTNDGVLRILARLSSNLKTLENSIEDSSKGIKDDSKQNTKDIISEIGASIHTIINLFNQENSKTSEAIKSLAGGSGNVTLSSLQKTLTVLSEQTRNIEDKTSSIDDRTKTIAQTLNKTAEDIKKVLSEQAAMASLMSHSITQQTVELTQKLDQIESGLGGMSREITDQTRESLEEFGGGILDSINQVQNATNNLDYLTKQVKARVDGINKRLSIMNVNKSSSSSNSQ